jgi:hypothetical protein
MKRLIIVVLLAFTLFMLCGCAEAGDEFQRGCDAGFSQAESYLKIQLEQAKGEAYDRGYTDGCRDGATQCQLCLRKPTYDEVITFIRQDYTEQMGGNCLDSAARLNDNAIAQGIWCYVVLFNYFTGTSYGFHAIVAFDTVDKGMVYIEPQTDQVVQLELGEDYSQFLCAGNKICPIQKMFVRQIGIIR